VAYNFGFSPTFREQIRDRGRTLELITRRVVGQLGFVGRAILPRVPSGGGFQPVLAALKGGCGHDWPPSKIKLTRYRKEA
jgi:hypothetical protein